MNAPPRISRQHFLWLVSTVLVLAAGATIGLHLHEKKILNTPVAAYLLPVDNDSRVKLSWWPAKKLTLPLALHSGEQLALPNGSKIKLVHADTGTSEDITGPSKIVLEQKLPSEPETLLSPIAEILATAKNAPLRPPSGIVFTSPVGVTRYLNPPITWIAAEGKYYDIAVLDPADPYVPPRVAKNIRPPIALATLETPQRRQLGIDRNYEIIIREPGAPTIAGGARFLTSPDAKLENQLPITPADLIAEATAALAQKPYRTGDAWLALQQLPAAWAKTELGVRLRLRVTAELGLPDDFARALSNADRLR